MTPRRPETSVSSLKQSALMHQRKGEIGEAESLYRRVLEIKPDEPDSLHMLGVICMETSRFKEAGELIFRALDLTHWSVDMMRKNLGLVLSRLLSDMRQESVSNINVAYSEFIESRQPSDRHWNPKVSVVLPSYNHSKWIGESIRSVYEQTYDNIEFIIIDDGSMDDSVQVINASIENPGKPTRFIARENRGAHATINEAIALSTGEFINVLNSDDYFPRGRVESLVRAVAGSGASWGFGGVRHIDAMGRALPFDEHPIASIYGDRLLDLAQQPSLGIALLAYNLAISTGNLFFSRKLFDRLGGFADLRYNHDWDFALRAALISEPVFVPETSYYYRIHGSNTITEGGGRIEADKFIGEFLDKTSNVEEVGENPFAPTFRNWGHDYLQCVARNGQAFLLPHRLMREAMREVLPVEPVSDKDILDIQSASSACSSIGAAGYDAYTRLVGRLERRPLMSIIMPTYNTPLKWLNKCILSVINQIYENWELCIADDASPSAELVNLLEKYAAIDERIRYVVRDRNGHISEASNTALSMVRGEYVVLLDHDDELTPDALYQVALVLNDKPGAGIIYSDEDKISEAGFKYARYFKPGWNPELLQAQNCISHLGVYRTDLVIEVGGFRRGFEGAQDWDLALRVSEHLSPEQIVRIPRVLYHWRSIAGSTAKSVAEKTYVIEAQRRALLEYHARHGRKVNLDRLSDHWLTSIDSELTNRRLTFFVDARGASYSDISSWVGAVRESTAGWDTRFILLVSPGADFLHGNPLGMILVADLTRNLGDILEEASKNHFEGECVVFCGVGWRPVNDGWLDRMASHALIKENGFISPRALTREGIISYAGCYLSPPADLQYPYIGLPASSNIDNLRAQLAQNFLVHCGPLMLVRKEVLHSCLMNLPPLKSWIATMIGLCLAARDAGFWNVWLPTATVNAPINTEAKLSGDDIVVLLSRWGSCFENDPSSHPFNKYQWRKGVAGS